MKLNHVNLTEDQQAVFDALPEEQQKFIVDNQLVPALSDDGWGPSLGTFFQSDLNRNKDPLSANMMQWVDIMDATGLNSQSNAIDMLSNPRMWIYPAKRYLLEVFVDDFMLNQTASEQ